MGEIAAYLDASILVSLFVPEPLSERADLFLQRPGSLIVSDFAAAEFASAIARRVRGGDFTADHARYALSNFDAWVLRLTRRVEVDPADVALAAAFLRRLDLPLRTPDAIHIAIAQRIGAAVVTFDRQMAAAAQALGIAVIEP